MTNKMIKLSTAILFMAVLSVQAQTSWNVNSDGNWATDSNWSTSLAPTSSDDAVVVRPYTATITTAAEANTVEIGSNSAGTTGEVSVNTGGSLAVTGGMIIGSAGPGDAEGLLTVDGGTVTTGSGISDFVSVGLFGTSRKGSVVLESGTFTVGYQMRIGGFNTSVGTVTMNGGTLNAIGADGRFSVGYNDGSATFNLTSGTLNAGGGFNAFRAGEGTGAGVANISGGVLSTNGIILNADDSGVGTINLDGGLIEGSNNFDGGFQIGTGGNVDFGDGVIQWAGDRFTIFNGFVTDGKFTVDTVTTEAYDASLADGSWTTVGGDTIYYDVGEIRTNYTTVWAAIPEPSTFILVGVSALALLAFRRRS